MRDVDCGTVDCLIAVCVTVDCVTVDSVTVDRLPVDCLTRSPDCRLKNTPCAYLDVSRMPEMTMLPGVAAID